MTTNKSVNFKVLGMHCGGCANKIKINIETLNIEHTVDINVSSGTVNIKFNSEQSSISNLKESISRAGFQIESINLE